MSRTRPFAPAAWGLAVGPDQALTWDGARLADLARAYGTPLHVLNATRLVAAARAFREAALAAHGGRATVCYALKANGLAATLAAVRRAGLGVEAMTPYELELALRQGVPAGEVIVNGPAKDEAFLHRCVEVGVRFVVVDGLEELDALARVAAAAGRPADLLLRVNPDHVPRGVARGTATASRRTSVFGLDLRGGELDRALDALQAAPALRLHGLHAHVGTGMRQSDAHARLVQRLAPAFRSLAVRGVALRVLDLGGGFASPTSREFTGWELLRIGALRPLPDVRLTPVALPPADAFGAVARTLRLAFPHGPAPEVIYEPGRSLVGPCQLLLLTVQRTKRRGRSGRFAVLDGGLGTVTLPTYYEWHEVLPCEGVERPATCRTTLVGPACFGGDVVYRGKRTPPLAPGEVLAVMDTGAYFLPLESSFGFPRSAVVSLEDGRATLARRRETHADMWSRDAGGPGAGPA